MGSVNGYTTEASVPQVEAVEFALRRVCLFLLTGTYPAAPCKAKAGDSPGCSRVYPGRCWQCFCGHPEPCTMLSARQDRSTGGSSSDDIVMQPRSSVLLLQAA